MPSSCGKRLTSKFQHLQEIQEGRFSAHLDRVWLKLAAWGPSIKCVSTFCRYFLHPPLTMVRLPKNGQVIRILTLDVQFFCEFQLVEIDATSISRKNLLKECILNRKV